MRQPLTWLAPPSKTSDRDLLPADIMSEDFDTLHFLNLSYTSVGRERHDFLVAGPRSPRDIARDALWNSFEGTRNIEILRRQADGIRHHVTEHHQVSAATIEQEKV